MLTIIFQTIWKRRLWPLAGILLGLFYGLWFAHQQHNIYRATGRIIITRSVDPKVKFGGQTRRTGTLRFGNELVRLRDDAVLNQVIRDLDLLNDPEYDRARKLHPDRASLRQALIAQIRSGLFIGSEPENSVVDISYSSSDPEYAAQIVNAIIHAFIQSTYQENIDRTTRAIQGPAAKLADLRQEVQSTQQQLIQIQRRLGGSNGFVAEDTRTQKNLELLIQNAISAQTATVEAQSTYNLINPPDPSSRNAVIDTLPNPSRLNISLFDDLDEARADRADLLATLGPSHPQVRALDARIHSLETLIAAGRDRRLQAARIALLQAQTNQQQSEAALDAETQRLHLNAADSAQYSQLLRQFSFARALYTTLYTQLRTAAIQAGLNSLQIEILDPAEPPQDAINSPPWFYATEFTLLGFLAGCVIALASQNFRRGLASREEVEAITRLPSLATLPRLIPLSAVQLAGLSTATRNLPVIEQPHSRFANGIGNLQLNLQLSATGAEPRYILFTSATPSEGKTTVAGNYAVTLAQTGPPGTRVLLIDADLHRPNLHHRFGLHGRFGLSTVLNGSTTFSSALQRVPEAPALDILAGGPVPPSPYLLLSSPAYLSLLRRAGLLYTHIIIDSPPVLAVADVILLCRLTDAVVYVVRQGTNTRAIVRRGRDLLAAADAPLAGVVLNGLHHRDDEIQTEPT